MSGKFEILCFETENIPFFLSGSMIRVSSVNPVLSTSEKILSFEELPNGWHYGEGKAPNRDTIKKALDLNNFLFSLNFNETDAFPGKDGEIVLTAYFKEHYLEIEIQGENFSLVYELGKKEVLSIDRVSEEEVRTEAIAISERIWSTSDYYTPNPMTNVKNDLSQKQVLSKIPTGTLQLGFRPSITFASNKQMFLSASTFENIILTSLRTPQSSGYLTNQSYQLPAE